MARKMTLAQAANHFHGAAKNLKENLEYAERLNVEMFRAEVVRLSSGPLKLKVMRRKAWDHPYARRHGTPKLEPDITNVQTGKFVHSWETEAPAVQNGALVSAVVNTDPKAAILEQANGPGKSRMFARRPHELAARNLRAVRVKRIATWTRAAFT